jgi:hypothetical protein
MAIIQLVRETPKLATSYLDRPDLKVLCITGYPLTVATQAGGLETNMHTLTKPFTLETLASRVEAIIGKS